MEASALLSAAKALESAIKAMERRSDSLDNWLTFWISLVVIGVAVELFVVIAEYRHDLKDFRRATIRTPDKPSIWMLFLGLSGAGLVAVGVTGELGIDSKSRDVETGLRNKNRELVGLFQGASSAAFERAINAEVIAKRFDVKIAEAQRGTTEAQRDAEVAKGEASEANALSKKYEAGIAESKAQVASANAASTEAVAKAEGERLERVKIEKQLAPRTLEESDREVIGKQLLVFAPRFSGRKVTISSYSADAEGIVFSLEIMDVLTRAKIDVDPVIGRTLPVGLVTLGVKVTGPIPDEMFIRALLTGIRARVDTDLQGEWDSKYSKVSIEVGVKPVAGLPKVVPADPK